MLNEKLVENIFKYFLFSIWLVIVPVFMLFIVPMLTIINFSLFLPTEILNLLSSKIGHYFIASIFLALILLPWSWSSIEIDFMGKPRYRGFNGKKFLITIFAIPIVFGYVVSLLGYSYYDVMTLYIEYSQNTITYINSVIDSEYFRIVLPLLPIVLMSFVLFKYFIYLFIIGFIQYIWFMGNIIFF